MCIKEFLVEHIVCIVADEEVGGDTVILAVERSVFVNHGCNRIGTHFIFQPAGICTGELARQIHEIPGFLHGFQHIKVQRDENVKLVLPFFREFLTGPRGRIVFFARLFSVKSSFGFFRHKGTIGLFIGYIDQMENHSRMGIQFTVCAVELFLHGIDRVGVNGTGGGDIQIQSNVIRVLRTGVTVDIIL